MRDADASHPHLLGEGRPVTHLPNPIVLQRADPFVLRTEDGYLFTGTHPHYDRIALRRAPSLGGLQDAEELTVWRRHADGPMSALIWAPEIHRIGKSWIIYFAAAPTTEIDPDTDTFRHRIFCLENRDTDPFSDHWIEKGQVSTGLDTFCLDATTFEHRGVRYLVWAQQDPSILGHSNLYIARMANPWTLAGQPVLLSTPDFPWEQVRFIVEEGPAVLLHGDRAFLTFSASGTGPEYAMGLLVASLDSDLLDPRSWRKCPEPVFVSNAPARQFGPGHNSFTTSPGGRDILVYHCRNYVEINGDPLGDPNRHARIALINWDSSGMPAFGSPGIDTRWTPVTTDVLPPCGRVLEYRGV
jgi:GH43 family beta-xylosidase